MKTGARNQIVGEVTEIRRGTLMSMAKVKIPAEAVISSVMTIESLEGMELKEGDRVQVVIKAVNVLLLKD
ncbi:MAG TPA: molybdenum-binding protein [Firmicutes bacterium]|nr:molybdenum-binding protein [Bacillota bacterium]